MTIKEKVLEHFTKFPESTTLTLHDFVKSSGIKVDASTYSKLRKAALAKATPDGAAPLKPAKGKPGPKTGKDAADGQSTTVGRPQKSVIYQTVFSKDMSLVYKDGVELLQEFVDTLNSRSKASYEVVVLSHPSILEVRQRA